ncbi:MAG: hypothetical protein P8X88_09320 [Gammaproteobacteria bacterium]
MYKKIPLLLIFLCLSSCRPSVLPHSMHQAEFDTSKIKQTQLLIHKIGKKRDLLVFEKDKNLLENDEFLMTIDFDNAPVIVVTNSGHTDKLTVTTTDYGEMSTKKLKELTNYILTSIEVEIGVKFTKVNANQ